MKFPNTPPPLKLSREDTPGFFSSDNFISLTGKLQIIMLCTSIIIADYTSKTTGNTSQKVVAKFNNSSELMFAASVEDVKASLAAGKTKGDVVVVNGQFGPYAAFSNFSQVETLA